MAFYITRRLIQALVVVLLSIFVVFVLLHALPGGTARAILGKHATPAQIADFARQNHLNDPLPVQFIRYVDQVLHLNLGYSYQQNQSVASLLVDRIPKTLVLTMLSLIVSVIIAVPMGVGQAYWRNRPVDSVLTTVAFIFYATPVFFSGLLFILLFSVHLHWLPAEAPQSSNVVSIFANFNAMVLPIITLALAYIAGFSRYTRSSTLDNLSEDYVQTAKAKGLSSRRVLFVHVLRNAALPLITFAGLDLPYFFGGAIVVEALFNYPGMGLLFWNAAQSSDYPILLGVTLIIALAVVIGSLIADLAYAVADPPDQGGPMNSELVPVAPTETAEVDLGGAPAADEVSPASVSTARAALAEFTSNRLAIAGTVLLLLLVGFCFIAPLFYHTDQVHTNDLAVRLPPSNAHPLGTDELGYDVLGRLMVAGQATMEIGIGAGLVAALIGTAWGAIAGYIGGTLDSAMMRVVDAMLAMPVLVLLIVLTSIIRPSVWVLIVILGCISWLVSSRLVRAETLTIKTRLYVQAFKMFGGRGPGAVVRHVIPNIIGTIIVFTTFLIADSVLAVAYLSFLGLGLPPPETTWGDMLSNGLNYVYVGEWWLIYPAGIAIVLLVMSFNLIGDGLRDVFAGKRAR